MCLGHVKFRGYLLHHLPTSLSKLLSLLRNLSFFICKDGDDDSDQYKVVGITHTKSLALCLAQK